MGRSKTFSGSNWTFPSTVVVSACRQISETNGRICLFFCPGGGGIFFSWKLTEQAHYKVKKNMPRLCWSDSSRHKNLWSNCPQNQLWSIAQPLFKMNGYKFCLFPTTWIYPRATSKGGAQGSHSNDSTYLARTWEICAVVFTSPLTSKLCSQLQKLRELSTSP